MSRFWFVTGVIFAIALASVLCLPQQHRGVAYTIWGKALVYTAAGAMVAVLWAIGFRPQLERGRTSLFAMFALIGMEAILFWFIRFAGTFVPQ